MAIITVVDNPDEYEEDTEDGKRIQIPFKPGKTLRAILNATEHRVRTGCLGNGACGLCLVRIIAGETAPPSDNECLQLNSEQLASGVRLACLVICDNDLTVEIINRVPVSAWRPIPEGQYHHASDKQHDKPYPLHDVSTYLSWGITRPCGVAVDIGTTSISLSLFELGNGHLLTTRHGMNPQIKDGLDILTRVNIAVESQRDSSRLQQDLLTAIKEALWDMAIADGIDLGQVCRMFFVGNTAILTLLTGANFQLLLDPRYWSRHLPLKLPDTLNWSIDWGIHPRTEIEIIPPLAGFVGSDLTAGILAADLTAEPGTLLIDFGTNSEMALWDGNTIWVTSAAGGPAFEGSGISCGMPAEKGAIYRLDLQKKEYSVIGQSKPEGICGSALVDLIADLIDMNLLTNIGQFSETTSAQSFELPETDIRLHKRETVHTAKNRPRCHHCFKLP